MEAWHHYPPVSITFDGGDTTVKAGTAATFVFTVVSIAVGNVGLSCGTLPKGTACSFAPASVSGTQNTALTITTTAPTVGAVRPVMPTPWAPQVPVYAMLLPVLGVVAMVGRGKKTGKNRIVLGSAGLTVLLFLAGCGGSSTPAPPPPPNPGTRPGNYMITITANNSTASLQGTSVVTLVVQ